MSLNQDALILVKKGIKTIEMRLLDSKRKNILVGDYIKFVSTEGANNELNVRVKGLHTYSDFYELYNKFDKVKLGYCENDIALPMDMDKYYSKDKIKEYGVLGIELETI